MKLITRKSKNPHVPTDIEMRCPNCHMWHHVELKEVDPHKLLFPDFFKCDGCGRQYGVFKYKS